MASRYGKVPMWWVERTATCRTALAVAVVLAAHADADGRCYPSRKTIAKHTKMSERQVTRALSDLEACGVVQVTRKNGALHKYKILTEPRDSDTGDGYVTGGAFVTGDISDAQPETFLTPTGDISGARPVTSLTPKQTNNRSIEQSEGTAPARDDEKKEPDWVMSLKAAVPVDVLPEPLWRVTDARLRMVLGRYLAWRLRPELNERQNRRLGPRFAKALAKMSSAEDYRAFEVGELIEAAKEMVKHSPEPIDSLWDLGTALFGGGMRARKTA